MKNIIIISIKELNKSTWGLIYQFIERFYEHSLIDSETFNKLKEISAELQVKMDVKYEEVITDLQLNTKLIKTETTFDIKYYKQDMSRDYYNLFPFYFLHKKFTKNVTFGINLEKFDYSQKNEIIYPLNSFFEIYRNTKPKNGQYTVYFVTERDVAPKNYKTESGYSKNFDDNKVSRYILPITEINQENFSLIFKEKNKESDKIEYLKKSIKKQNEDLKTDILDKYCRYIFEEWFIKAYFISQNQKIINDNTLYNEINLLKSYCDNIKELVENIIFHTDEQKTGLYPTKKEGIIYVIFNEKKNLTKDQGEKLKDFNSYKDTDRFAEIGIMDFNAKGIVDKYKEEITRTGITTVEPEVNIIETGDEINLSYFFDTEKMQSTGLTSLDLKNIAHLGIKIFAKSVKNYDGYFYVESNTDGGKTSVEYSKTELADEVPLEYFFNGTHYEIVFPLVMKEKKNYTSNTKIDDYKENKWKINSIDFAPIYNAHKIENYDIKTELNDKIRRVVKELSGSTNEQTDAIALNMKNVNIGHIILLKILVYFQFESKNKETGFKIILLTHLSKEFIDECCHTIKILLLDNNKETILDNQHAIVLLSDTLEKCQIFCGKTKDEFLYLNNAISKIYLGDNYFYKENFNQENIKDFNTLNEFVQYYECITGNGEIFVNHVLKILNTPIEIDGYGCKVSNEITRLSSRIAIKTYYEADFLFQNSFFANRFAQMIFENLKNKNIYKENKKDIVIIGYCYYSELLIKRLQFLTGINLNKQPTIIIANESFDENKENELDFINIAKIKENPKDYFYVVVVPISSTLTTIDKIIALLKKEIKSSNLNPTNFTNYCAILTRDEEKKCITPKEYIHGWKNILPSDKIIETKFTNAEKVGFILQKQGEWIENFDKKLFPINWLEEEPINNTKNASLNSQNLMGYPFVYSDIKDINEMEQRLEAVKDFIYCGHLTNEKHHYRYSVDEKGVKKVDCGHLTNGKYHQRYCFCPEDFIKEDIEKQKIKQQQNKKTTFHTWLHKLKNNEKFINLEQKNNILITPYSDVEVDFVNIVNKELFDNKAQILYIEVDKPRGNINFKYSFLKKHKDVAYHFVDNVLSTGETLKRAKSYLLSILEEYDRKNEIKFESIITFVNRLSKNRVQEIIKYDGQEGSEIIFSFITLFIPPAKEFNKKCSLCELIDLYGDMKKNTVLNSCIKTIDDKAKKIREKSFEEMKKYKDKTIEDRNFAKMKLTHQIYYEISKIKGEKQITNSNEILELDQKIYDRLDIIYKDCIIRDDKEDYKRKIEKLSFLKSISSPPLNQYVKIRYYAHKTLLNALNELFKIEEPNYHNIKELKVILKQLSCLGANALVRREVIVKSWNVYYKFKKDVITKNRLLIKNIISSLNKDIEEFFTQDIKSNLDNPKLFYEIKEKEISRYKLPIQLLLSFNTNSSNRDFVTKSCNVYINFINQYREIMDDREKDEVIKRTIIKEYSKNLTTKIQILKKEILGVENYKETDKIIKSVNQIKDLFNNSVFKENFDTELNKILLSESFAEMFICNPIKNFKEGVIKYQNEVKKIKKVIKNQEKEIEDQKDFCSEFQFFIKTAIYKDETKSMWLGELLRTGKETWLEEQNTADIKISRTTIGNSLFTEFKDKEYQHFLVWLFYDNTTVTRKTLENLKKEDFNQQSINESANVSSLFSDKFEQYYYFAFKKYINQKQYGSTGNPDKIDFIEKLIYVLDAKMQLEEMLENIKQNKNELDYFKNFIPVLLDIFKNIMNAEDVFFSMKNDNEKIYTVAQSQNFTKEINYENSFVKHIFGLKEIINPLQISKSLTYQKNRNDNEYIEYYEKSELGYKQMICLPLFKQDYDKEKTKNDNKLLKINGIFSFLFNDLENFEVVSKEYGRLLLLLKPELDEYIEHILSEKIFDLWEEKEEKLRFYEEKFEKFNHTAKKYIEKTDIVRMQNNDNALFAFNELVFGQVILGHYYAEYLKVLEDKNGLKLSEPMSKNEKFDNEDKKYLNKFISGLQYIYSENLNDFANYEIYIKGYENITSLLKFADIKIIIVELISNALDCERYCPNRKVVIDFQEDKMIYKSLTGKIPQDGDIEKIKSQIHKEYPQEGIGLFMIQKIIKSALNKDIQIEFDYQTNEFQVIIPIK